MSSSIYTILSSIKLLKIIFYFKWFTQRINRLSKKENFIFK
jgi:hypothetical protein